MRLNITSESGNGYGFRLPDEKEVEEELKDARNFEMVKERMQNIVQVLNDFKNRREDGKKRGQYLNVFRKDLCTYYGYNEFLMEKFMALFPNGSEVGKHIFFMKNCEFFTIQTTLCLFNINDFLLDE